MRADIDNKFAPWWQGEPMRHHVSLNWFWFWFLTAQTPILGYTHGGVG